MLRMLAAIQRGFLEILVKTIRKSVFFDKVEDTLKSFKKA